MTFALSHLAAAALAGTVSLGVAAPALAQDDTTAAVTGDRCVAAVDRRLDHLAEARHRIESIEAVGDDHEATIVAALDAAATSLADLRSEIATASDTTEVREACRRVVEDVRVYRVVLPQARLAVGADRATVVVERGESALTRLDDAIARAEAAGADVAPVRTLRDEARAHLAAAGIAADGVADAVLGVTAADWNDGPGREVLDDARSDLRAARSAWRDARDSGRAAVAAWREAMAGTS